MRSYSDKFPEVLNLILSYKLDILCLTETWFNVDSEYFVPEGFSLYRKDRQSRGGGVAIIVMNNLSIANCKY